MIEMDVKEDTTTMSDIVYDLCIVGAGMFGSAAARHASANAGIKVCLVGAAEPKDEDRENCEIFAAHYDEGRIVHNLDEDLPSIFLSKHSIRRFRELEILSGIQFYYPVGFLEIGRKGSSYISKLKQIADYARLPVVDLSFKDIFKTRFPYIKISDDDCPILDDTGSGHLSPRNMVAAQKKVANMQGCHIIEDVVDEVKPLVDGIHEIVTKQKKIVKAKRVLFCTGAFINFKKFPIPKFKIHINKETVCLLKISDVEAGRLSAMPSIIYDRPDEKVGFYILPPIQYPDGTFYLKSGHIDYEIPEEDVDTLEKIKKWCLSEGDTEKVEKMANFLIELLPGLKVERISSMTCVTCHNPSGQPYIDRISPTMTVAAVGNGKGAKISEEVGRIAATLSLTGKWDSVLPKTIFRIALHDQ